ncbi:ABC transporter substrate-binding protein [Janibacter sp. G1551]|uniref:ABC transporter substrate-binding protein n=1 Tax=Janibacter sp. G1551 TaxID=3420440 RepID=UPI003D00CD9A
MADTADVEPFLVGYLDEGLFPEDAMESAVARVLRMRFDEALADGEVDRPIELVVRRGRGLPRGTALAVQSAWTELADAGCLVVLGPGITDNCLAVRPLYESRGVPTITFPGTVHSRGGYGFQYQLGSLTDDGPLVVRALADAGLREVAVIRDRSPIGREFFEAFAAACESAGVAVVADSGCSPNAEDLTDQVAASRASGAGALVYLGYGAVLHRLSAALDAAGWDVPRFTTTAGLHFYSSTPEQRVALGEWVYVDQVDEGNAALEAMLDRFERRYGDRPFDPITGCLYDMATLAVLGLAHAPVHTPDGVREGLEQIHQEPAVLGGPGTVQGFGPWERSALKGAHYLVLRQMAGKDTVRYVG